VNLRDHSKPILTVERILQITVTKGEFEVQPHRRRDASACRTCGGLHRSGYLRLKYWNKERLVYEITDKGREFLEAAGS